MSLSDAARYLDLVARDRRTLALLARAARNETPHVDVSDWLITLHFYILCIYMKALGRCRGLGFHDHVRIRSWINTESDLLMIARSYRKAEEWSREARYEGRTVNADEVLRFHGWFAHVRDRLTDLLKQAGISATRIPVVEPVSS